MSAGHVARTSDLGQGLYALEVVVPQASEPISLQLVGKTPDKSELQASASLDVAWGPADNYQLEATPSRLELGKGGTAKLVLGVRGEGGVDLEHLTTRSIHGQLGSWSGQGREAGGVYTPASVAFPHIDIVFAEDPTAPSVFGWTGLAMAGEVAFPVHSAANTPVSIKIGGRSFGPVTTDQRGSARVPITVEPGVSEAELISVVDGKSKSEPLDLKVPDTQRLLFAPPPKQILADPERPRSLYLVVLRPDGRPDPKAELQLAVEGGTAAEPKHVGGGLYEVVVTPAAQTGTLRVTATIAGEAKQVDTVEAELVASIPGRIALRTVPETVSPQDASAALYVYVQGAGASDAKASDLAVRADGAAAAGALAKADTGIFAAQFTLEGRKTGPRFFGSYAGAPTGEQAVHLAVRSLTGAVANDGASDAAIQVAAFDELGRPVPGVNVALSLTSGGGRLPSSVRTGADGTAEVRYRSGADVGLVGIRATTGRLSAATALVQGPPGSVPLGLPATGGPAAERAVAALELLHPSLDFSGVGVVSAEAPKAKTPKEKTPKDKSSKPARSSGGDEPLVVARALLGGGVYSYQQTPEPGADTQLLPSPFVIGRGYGAPGIPVGFQVGAHGGIPDLPYVAWDAALGLDSHSVGLQGFSTTIANPMMHGTARAIGRYPLELGGLSTSAGAHLGLAYRSFLVVEGSAQTAISFRRERVLGADLGLDFDVRAGDISGRAVLGMELARGDVWASDIQLSGAYALDDQLGVRVTLERVGRGVDIGGGLHLQGHVEDQLWVLRAGAEWGF